MFEDPTPTAFAPNACKPGRINPLLAAGGDG
jgi:hypothetical protein